MSESNGPIYEMPVTKGDVNQEVKKTEKLVKRLSEAAKRLETQLSSVLIDGGAAKGEKEFNPGTAGVARSLLASQIGNSNDALEILAATLERLCDSLQV